MSPRVSPRPSSRATRRRRADADLGPPSGLVAIVGRPNVGKSTLFNRLTGERRAIVDEMAGLTRDRLYGITSLDLRVSELLRRGGKPVVLAGNKAESRTDSYLGHELWSLGLGEPVMVSALQGTDTGDLLDRVFDLLPPADPEAQESEADQLRIAIIGRPNVGKSSLLNAIAGEERALVSPVAGTTRDTVDTVIEHQGSRIRLVDTAGIRRRGVVDTNVEHYSLLRSLRAMERSDVAVLVSDVSEGTVAQDRHVAGYAAEAGKGLVIVANKWDLLDAETRSDPETLKRIASAFDFVHGVPVLTVSATEGRNVAKVLDAAIAVAQARLVRVGTGALNTLLRTAMEERPPRIHKLKRLKLMYAAQASTPAPTFVLFVNDPDLMHFSYQRYLENRIRAVFGFNGVPIRMLVRRRDQSPGRR